MNTLHRDEDAEQLGLERSEVGRVSLRLTQPLFFDLRLPAATGRTGGLILIDEATNATVGAVMITEGR